MGYLKEDRWSKPIKIDLIGGTGRDALCANIRDHLLELVHGVSTNQER